MKVVRVDAHDRYDPEVVARGMSGADAARFAAMKNAEIDRMEAFAKNVGDYFIVRDEEE